MRSVYFLPTSAILVQGSYPITVYNVAIGIKLKATSRINYKIAARICLYCIAQKRYLSRKSCFTLGTSATKSELQSENIRRPRSF